MTGPATGALLRELPNRLATAAGVILFTGRRRSGLLFLAALALDPSRLVLGLAGALVAMTVGGLAARSPVWQKLGFFGGSGMLTALALSAYLPVSGMMVAFTALCAALSAMVLLALVPLLGKHDMPILALPFVSASLVGLSAAPVLGLKIQAGHGIDNWLLPVFEHANHALAVYAPHLLDAFLRTIGSLLFLPEPLAGVLILVGLVLGSRITALAMAGGALVSVFLLQFISGQHLSSSTLALLAFNGVLIAAAFTGIFVALTRQALVYALLAVITGVVLTAGIQGLFDPMGLPVLALPFCLASWLFLLPLKTGSGALERHAIWAPPLALIGRAEDNLRAFERWKREQQQPQPVLTMPLHGVWTITQGPMGNLTHSTINGKHAWDFMLLDEQGRAASGLGAEREDFHGFGCPVLAPADGVVTAMEGRMRDNAVHAVDTEHPWGNWVMITHENGMVSLLAHLRAGSLRVLPGQGVQRGQEIAQLGNSGRSPEPHLHLQLNDGPWLASRSQPAVFGSWLELRPGQGPLFHPLGTPQEGMRVCTLTHMDWPDWSACLPLSVPGRRFVYTETDSSDEVVLEVIAGSWGRLLLDDGLQRAQVVYWPGWIQLLPLREGDPDWRCLHHGRSLVQALLEFSSVLPLMGSHELEVRQDVHSTGLAGGLRRSFSLEGRGKLSQLFRREPGPLSPLTCRSELVLSNGRSWTSGFVAEPGRGLVEIQLNQGGRHKRNLRLREG
ncbi:MAG: urea transporter [Calditrichaeota bacterium]|nr:urea transporter [Calditrichota bacterium]